jgi:ankyrin repeat protein
MQTLSLRRTFMPLMLAGTLFSSSVLAFRSPDAPQKSPGTNTQAKSSESFYWSDKDIQEAVKAKNYNAALMRITMSKNPDINTVKEILANGADINAREPFGQMSVLFMAAARDHTEIVKLLLDRKALVHQGLSQASILHVAARNGGEDLIKILLAVGYSHTALHGINGGTPLHESAWSGNSNTAKALLDAGADPQAKNDDGLTPPELAKKRGHKAVTAVFEEYAAKNKAEKLEPHNFSPAGR